MTERNRVFRGMLAGMAGGMVASWAVNRFYDLARESSQSRSIVPYIAGAAIGAAYATFVHRRPELPLIAHIPLGAAVRLGEPEEALRRGGRDLGERARNIAMRTASRQLKIMAERALFA